MTAVHYSPMQPNASGRALAACGVWSPSFTADPDLITCPACLSLRKPTPTPTKTGTNNMRTLLTLTTALLLAAACDPEDPASTTNQSEPITTSEDASSSGGGETDSGETGGGSESTGGSTGGDSTAGDEPTSSTGTGGSGEGDGSGSTDADAATCFASCSDVDCAPGLICAPHPDTMELTCVMPCSSISGCDEVVPFLCDGDAMMAAECRLEFAVPLCFPVE
ncbi:MAG TPA: hypothetical protein VGB85_00115 [Nannocystis sp.]|jgi:hypothetical protein